MKSLLAQPSSSLRQWLATRPRAPSSRSTPRDLFGGRQYVIGAGDVLQVRVFQQEAMSARVRVRHDGKVSLPMVNDWSPPGKTPAELAAELQTRLKEFINNARGHRFAGGGPARDGVSGGRGGSPRGRDPRKWRRRAAGPRRRRRVDRLRAPRRPVRAAQGARPAKPPSAFASPGTRSTQRPGPRLLGSLLVAGDVVIAE
jgi:hypothetical protein